MVVVAFSAWLIVAYGEQSLPLIAEQQQLLAMPPLCTWCCCPPMLQHTVLVLLAAIIAVHTAFAIAGI